jgi:hypothetical protein
VFCASCTATLVSALEVVPKTTLAAAHDRIEQFSDVEHRLSVECGKNAELEQKVAQLEGRLDGAISERESLKRTLREFQKARETERRVGLLGTVAAQAANGEPTAPKAAAKKKVAGAS